MRDGRDELTADAVVAYAARCGVSVSRSQLERWHKAGLMPRPRRVHLGRGKGTESRYPVETAPQAVTLALGRTFGRSLDVMAWYAWTHRFPVTPYIRKMLQADLDAAIRTTQEEIKRFEAEDPSSLIDQADGLPTLAGFAPIRAAFRSTLLRIVMQVALGELDGDTLFDRDEDAAAVFPQEVRLAKARTHTKHPADSVREALLAMSSEINLRQASRALRRLSDAQLERTRDEALYVMSVLETYWRMPPLPLSEEFFHAVFLMTRVSPHGRYLIRCMRQEFKTRGFTTLREAFDAYKAYKRTQRSAPAER
jgi:hypothetical protein